MDRKDIAQERTKKVTELKKLFTMPHGAKRSRRAVNSTEKVSFIEYRVKMFYLNVTRVTKRGERKCKRDSENNG